MAHSLLHAVLPSAQCRPEMNHFPLTTFVKPRHSYLHVFSSQLGYDTHMYLSQFSLQNQVYYLSLSKLSTNVG